MLLVLRDGRLLVGTLSSYDQYGSIVLEGAKERISCGGKYADNEMGMYMIRGENIMLMGELDEQLEAANPFLERQSSEVVEGLIAADSIKSGGVKGGVAGLTLVRSLGGGRGRGRGGRMPPQLSPFLCFVLPPGPLLFPAHLCAYTTTLTHSRHTPHARLPNRWAFD